MNLAASCDITIAGNRTVTAQGFRGKLDILEKRRLDLDAARRDYNRLELKRVKKSENNLEPPAELIIQIQAKETALNGKPNPILILSYSQVDSRWRRWLCTSAKYHFHDKNTELVRIKASAWLRHVVHASVLLRYTVPGRCMHKSAGVNWCCSSCSAAASCPLGQISSWHESECCSQERRLWNVRGSSPWGAESACGRFRCLAQVLGGSTAFGEPRVWVCSGTSLSFPRPPDWDFTVWQPRNPGQTLAS